MAFGAVGGIESGITLGERYDIGQFKRPPREGRNDSLHRPASTLPSSALS